MKKPVLYLLLFLPLLCFSQKDSLMTRINYKMPECDFIIFTLSGKSGYYTGEINTTILEEEIRFARMMSSIPPKIVILFDKGKEIESTRAGGHYSMSVSEKIDFASNIKKVELMSETFDRKRKLSKKKKQLLTKQNVYLLENEEEYVLEWYEF